MTSSKMTLLDSLSKVETPFFHDVRKIGEIYDVEMDLIGDCLYCHQKVERGEKYQPDPELPWAQNLPVRART